MFNQYFNRLFIDKIIYFIDIMIKNVCINIIGNCVNLMNGINDFHMTDRKPLNCIQLLFRIRIINNYKTF